MVQLSIIEAASRIENDLEQGFLPNEAKNRLARYEQNKRRKGKYFDLGHFCKPVQMNGSGEIS
ncbi:MULTISPECIES: hypothetical protein [Methylomonas]|jgi:hypothetical protein|uniref:Uncharacterized protein n=1 Tax=Methylomonas methanica TaxID=421 RepID=A0A177MQ56_METMH|nr:MULTISPECIES: hypothetical protein [Methylomonas]OAI06989.1 hypothetical protein A1353_08115 [Methylomonas methanica]